LYLIESQVFSRAATFVTRLGVAGSADQLSKRDSPSDSESPVEGVLIARTLSPYRHLCYPNELTLLH